MLLVTIETSNNYCFLRFMISEDYQRAILGPDQQSIDQVWFNTKRIRAIHIVSYFEVKLLT